MYKVYIHTYVYTCNMYMYIKSITEKTTHIFSVQLMKFYMPNTLM